MCNMNVLFVYLCLYVYLCMSGSYRKDSRYLVTLHLTLYNPFVVGGGGGFFV